MLFSILLDLESMQKEINDLKRQNKLLKQNNSDKMMVQSKKSLDSIHQKVSYTFNNFYIAVESFLKQLNL